MRILMSLTLAVVILAVAGCAAVETSVAKRNLDVQTRISTPIFVDPVKKERRTVYVDVRSAVMEFDRHTFSQAMQKAFDANDNGYRMVDDPDTAQYQLNVFIRNLEKSSPTAAEQSLKQGYNDVKVGSAIGASYGREQSGSVSGAAVGGVLGALATTTANAFVQDVTYMLVGDIQIKEKTRKGVFVRKDTNISANVSDSGSSTQQVSEVSKYKEYHTRVVTTANKVNLTLDEAQDLMFAKTAYAISGFF